MGRTTTAALFAVFCGLSSPAAAQPTELDMEKRLCADMGREVPTKSGARIDCLNAEFAIEIDWTEKWAEAIGQALDYAHETGRKPGVILICKQSQLVCLGHVLRFEATIAFWDLPFTWWRCDTSSRTLDDCLVRTRN